MPAINVDIIIRDGGVLDRLEEVSTVSIPTETADTIEEILSRSIERLRSYPPETNANKPPPPYYTRGVGYFGRGGRLSKVSEDLQSQWSMNVSRSQDTVTGVLANRASYAKYVHNKPGDPDPPWQASFHGRRGWPTVQDVVRDEAGIDVDTGSAKNKFQQAIDRVANIFRR